MGPKTSFGPRTLAGLGSYPKTIKKEKKEKKKRKPLIVILYEPRYPSVMFPGPLRGVG